MRYTLTNYVFLRDGGSQNGKGPSARIIDDGGRRIHDAYAGDKNIVMVDGTHNSRPKLLSSMAS